MPISEFHTYFASAEQMAGSMARAAAAPVPPGAEPAWGQGGSSPPTPMSYIGVSTCLSKKFWHSEEEKKEEERMKGKKEGRRKKKMSPVGPNSESAPAFRPPLPRAEAVDADDERTQHDDEDCDDNADDHPLLDRSAVMAGAIRHRAVEAPVVRARASHHEQRLLRAAGAGCHCRRKRLRRSRPA